MLEIIKQLEEYRTKVNDYCNTETDFKKASKHSYISDKISNLIEAIGDFELHNTENCPLYGDKILPDEEGKCSLCGGIIHDLI